MNEFEIISYETKRKELKMQRQARARRRRRRMWRRRIQNAGIIFVVILLILMLRACSSQDSEKEVPSVSDMAVSEETTYTASSTDQDLMTVEPFYTTENTATISGEFPSQYAVLIEADSGEIIAQRNSDATIYPASMTKVLTLLVAAENIIDTDGTWIMTQEATDYCFENECSVVGYETGEMIPVEELFYGCILCSGADACMGLAELAAGSHEAFVALMNEKLDELGIGDTSHFTNCVGLFDEGHYCTAEDMALILRTAMENEFCRQILTTSQLTSEPTTEHPDGQTLTNWFVLRVADQDTGSVSVSAGKTGYVEEAGFCAASYAQDTNGTAYLCVTADSTSSWQSVYDHAELYRAYCG